jgi:uroporphyrinogen decarboxylase
LLYRRPDLLHHILDVNCRAVIAYLNAQIEAGAQVVMLFDTWGGILGASEFREFSLKYLQRTVEGLTREHRGERVPNILFTKGAGGWLEDMAASGCDALGLDWTVDIGVARRRVGGEVSLQGNLDPAVLLADPDAVRAAAGNILSGYGKGAGHVFNLGHGISPFTPPENVSVLVETVRSTSRAYH